MLPAYHTAQRDFLISAFLDVINSDQLPDFSSPSRSKIAISIPSVITTDLPSHPSEGIQPQRLLTPFPRTRAAAERGSHEGNEEPCVDTVVHETQEAEQDHTSYKQASPVEGGLFLRSLFWTRHLFGKPSREEDS